MIGQNKEEMEQPELGKKIVQLRKASQLTQEELVEKCNISIRTIQRIESGDVTPRSYTVKTIFAALNYEPEDVNPVPQKDQAMKYFSEHSSKKPAHAITWLTASWYVGMCYFIIRFVEGIAEYSRFISDDPMDNSTYVIIKVFILLTLALFQSGFIRIGEIFDNRLLKMSSLLVIAVSFIVIGFDIVATYYNIFLTDWVIYAYSFGYGAVGLVFGFSLLNLRKDFGNIAIAAGVIEILGGCLSLSVIFAFMQPVVLIPAELLEIVIIFLAIRKVKKVRG